MFIIYGSKDDIVTGSSGSFYCPKCACITSFEMKQVQHTTTLFFVPVATSEGACFVECLRCSTRYDQAVLDYEPPTQEERNLLLAQKLLTGGVSAGKVQARLEEIGYDAVHAEDVVSQLCEGKFKRCECGRRYHPNVFRCDDCGIALPL